MVSTMSGKNEASRRHVDGGVDDDAAAVLSAGIRFVRFDGMEGASPVAGFFFLGGMLDGDV